MRIFFARFPGANNPCQGEPKRGTSDEGSCVLSTPLFTRFGLVVMTSIYDWVMKDDDEMQGWQRAAGPMVFLIGMAVCVLSIWVTGNEIGEISCRFRLSYSPGNGAFAIWSVLFPWHFVSVFVQFLANFYPESLYSARFEANLLMGLAWVASGGILHICKGTGFGIQPRVCSPCAARCDGHCILGGLSRTRLSRNCKRRANPECFCALFTLGSVVGRGSLDFHWNLFEERGSRGG